MTFTNVNDQFYYNIYIKPSHKYNVLLYCVLDPRSIRKLPCKEYGKCMGYQLLIGIPYSLCTVQPPHSANSSFYAIHSIHYCFNWKREIVHIQPSITLGELRVISS